MKRRAIVRRLATIIRITEEEVRQLRAASADDTAAVGDVEDLEQAFVGETAGEVEVELDLDQVQRLAALESPMREQLLALVAEMVDESTGMPEVLLEEREDGSQLRAELSLAWKKTEWTPPTDVLSWLVGDKVLVSIQALLKEGDRRVSVRFVASSPSAPAHRGLFVTENEGEARRWLGWEASK